ncbi:BolA/IbaG family iron-sulfur metabolism protein [Pelagibacterales bacterium SAG-MED10]|jgi:BolA protein|nr:BolA/IbaG family iron-sulfur metabolism protein [Pelagibacterales bacterium SAG-MED33]MBD1159763.1 BolA/IbaG family iron-sulfur metabolism protein [Pelagibacterales bacterium SAG-MED14]MBD1165747.1 BolA/IbaG family iron-sulfur metabolism protein [Pelagibacterales bacterium SAG-MED10]MBD1168927.1 BolA/IbaG family iron-sulfur metabolism protein [Pelagibacterales bacterium SAG-MED08]
MDINDLIAIVKKKLQNQINIENIKIEDKSFLHKNHAGNQEGKFHLKISLISNELKTMNKIESNKKIYKILDKEIKESIHSIQILIL